MSNENFAVLNALNLINKKLGTLYQEKGFNPFQEDYVLTAEGAEKLLNINVQKKFVESPKILEESEASLKAKIKLAQIRAEELVQMFQQLVEKGNASPKMLKQLIYVKICVQLLKGLDLKNLNYEEILEVLKTITVLSPEFCVVFNRVFDKDFDVQIALTDFVKLCKSYRAKKETKAQQDLQTLVHGEYHQSTVKTRPKPKAKVSEKEIEK